MTYSHATLPKHYILNMIFIPTQFLLYFYPWSETICCWHNHVLFFTSRQCKHWHWFLIMKQKDVHLNAPLWLLPPFTTVKNTLWNSAQAAQAGFPFAALWRHVQFCHLWTTMTRHKSMLSINRTKRQRIARYRQIKFSKERSSPWPKAQFNWKTHSIFTETLEVYERGLVVH